MTMRISPINFTASHEKQPKISEQKREEIRDGVVAGGAAGAGYTAVKKNTLNMLKETEAACKAGKAAAAARTAEAAKVGTGLFSGLKNNARVLTQRLVAKLDAVKTSRFVKPIINNRLTRFGCGVVGGALAVCILISGLGSLYHNSVELINNYAPRVAHRVNQISDRFESSEKN